MNKWKIVGECSCCQEEMYSYQATTCPDCLAEICTDCIVSCEACGRLGCPKCFIEDEGDWYCCEDCRDEDQEISRPHEV